MRRHWVSLLVFLTMCMAVLALGASTTAPAVEGWYAQLEKPLWTPPSWVFAPVWSMLYVSMAVAAWIVWCQQPSRSVTRALGLFAMQLLLNATWSPVFFALQQPRLAFGVILLLWGSLVATLVAFWRISPGSGWLLTPYLAWVTYAAGLNFAIWQLNTWTGSQGC